MLGRADPRFLARLPFLRMVAENWVEGTDLNPARQKIRRRLCASKAADIIANIGKSTLAQMGQLRCGEVKLGKA